MPAKKINLKTISKETFNRSAIFERDSIDEEKRTVNLAFSSEEPYERYWGIEILDHAAKSVRLERINDGPLLVDHDTRDHVGVVESVSIDADRVGRASVRFGKSARAEEIFNDVKDGIRKSISVGYRIHKATLEEKTGDNDSDTYRVNDWEPIEISLVSIPADDTVGIGRSEESFNKPETKPETKIERKIMPETIADIDKIKAEARAEARKTEQSRVSILLKIGEQYGTQQLAQRAISEGMSENDLNKLILESRGHETVVEATAPDIGLTGEEVRQFSFMRSIHALANPSDRRAQEAASFEFECSRAAGEKTGKEASGILVPVDVLKRDLVAGTDTAGGHTVSTDLLAGNFIELLRNKAIMMQLGTSLTSLNGNIAIPRMTGGASAYWVAESGEPTESQQAFDQVTLSPKTVGAYTDISRKLMLQSSIDIEALVRSDLATTLALEIDRAAINGSGASNQPLGILGTSGIGAVAGGTNGLAMDWSHVVDLETEVAQDNADIGRLAYVMNSKVRGTAKQTLLDAGSGRYLMEGTELNGYQAKITNQVPSDLNKGTSTGVCSAIIFGNFADMLLGFWGGLDITVDPYTHSKSGTVRVVTLQDMDIAIRHAESFAAMQDALTS